VRARDPHGVRMLMDSRACPRIDARMPYPHGVRISA
jgi:hypothetical protein